MTYRLVRVLCVLVLVLASAALFAQEDFSADIVTSKQGKASSQGKFYVTKDKLRMEMNGSGGEGAIVILNLATHTSAVLMPARKMYMEMPTAQGPTAQRTWAFFRSIDVDNACPDWQKYTNRASGECHKVGSATVNGRSTVEYEGKSADGKVGHVWLDSKIAFPIKWEEQDNEGELQNIKTGSQPSSLFEVPSDYQKFQMPAGMPNMPNH